MKKKLLPLAMLAGLAGAVGTVQAAHVNTGGLGQVLIYPYYRGASGAHKRFEALSKMHSAQSTLAVKRGRL